MIGMHHPDYATVDLGDVRLFVAVARLASYVAASRKTGVPTSTVSRAVVRLEEALGTRLLHRTSRKVVPTQEGAWLLERAAPLLEELSTTLEDVKARDDEPSGRLRVTAPVATGSERVARALIEYAARHPRLSLDLQLSNRVLNLREEGLDLAFRAGPVTDGDLVAKKLWSVAFGLAASPSFVKKVLRGRRTLSAAKLAELPAVVTQAGSRWVFRGPGAKLTPLKPNEHFIVNDPRVAVAAAKSGLGVLRAARELLRREGDALVLLECELGELQSREMYAVYPSRRLLPQRVKGAIDWVTKHGPGSGA